MQPEIPFWLGAIFLAAVTAASMTTGEKLILISASGFSEDFYRNYKQMKGVKIPDEKLLFITRIATIVVVGVALFLALLQPSFVLDLCMFAWSAMAATIMIPMIFGLFWKKGTKTAAWVSGIAALSVAVIWWLVFKWPAGKDIFATARAFEFTTVPFKVVGKDIHEFIVSQVVALILFPLVSIFTQPPNKEFVESIFNDFKVKKKIIT
jgi:Na+/proline symporter